MKKKHLKKNNPNRRQALMLIREEKPEAVLFTSYDGKQFIINPVKKYLKGKEYKHTELRAEMSRALREVFTRAASEVEKNKQKASASVVVEAKE